MGIDDGNCRLNCSSVISFGTLTVFSRAACTLRYAGSVSGLKVRATCRIACRFCVRSGSV